MGYTQSAVLGLFSCILTLDLFIFVLNSVSFCCFMALCDDRTHTTLCAFLGLTACRSVRQFCPGSAGSEGMVPPCAPPRNHTPSKGLAGLRLSVFSPHNHLETLSLPVDFHPAQPVNRIWTLYPPTFSSPQQAGNDILQVVKQASSRPDGWGYGSRLNY